MYQSADAQGLPDFVADDAPLEDTDVVLWYTLGAHHVVRPEDVLGDARAGRTVVLAGDTAPAASVVEAATGADLLVHEATFCEDERERAAETRHSTARGAAELALAAEVSLLALTHLSNRYSGGEVVREAREYFGETVVPRDFDTIDVRFEERGGPVLVKGGAVHEHGREREVVTTVQEATK